MAFKARQAIANGEFYPFIPALAFALADDALLDPMLTIPIVGLVVVLPSAAITVYLFIFLFGKGTWKVRMLVFALQVLDWFPVINLLPMSTVSVLYVYYQAKKKADQARKELPVIQSNAEQIRGYQMARARLAMEEAERLAPSQAPEADSKTREQEDLRNRTLKLKVLRTSEQKEGYNAQIESQLAGMERLKKRESPPREAANDPRYNESKIRKVA